MFEDGWIFSINIYFNRCSYIKSCRTIVTYMFNWLVLVTDYALTRRLMVKAPFHNNTIY